VPVQRPSRARGACDQQAAQNRSLQALHAVSIHLFKAVAKSLPAHRENPGRRE
jgi:hypothetical protein